KLGDKFLSNFSVLNYLQQDSKSIVIPDECDKRSRTGQIEHLINLEELKKRIDNIGKLKSASKEQLAKAIGEHAVKKDSLKELQDALTVNDSEEINYTKLTDSTITPQWDMERPFSVENYKHIS
ncbi:hypothetical protein CGH27_24945, partial [Vibrio parahaemolyticus]